MFQPPRSDLFLLQDEPVTRPVYDNPPVISSSPRWGRLRRFAADLKPRRPTADLPGPGPHLGTGPLRPHLDRVRREAS
jgi:hypothetical protein